MVFNFNSTVNSNFKSFYYQVNNMTNIIFSGDYRNETSLKPHLYPQYMKEFATFYDTWLMNKYVGGGIKNFRYYCHKASKKDKKKESFICNMHPHNYYLEILTETGLIGFIIGREMVEKEFNMKLSNKFNIHRTRKNFPNDGIDTFENMAKNGIKIVDKVVLEELNGKIDSENKLWLIPK